MTRPISRKNRARLLMVVATVCVLAGVLLISLDVALWYYSDLSSS